MHITAKFPLIASLVGVDDITNMIYVTNTGSDTVSIIDGYTDSVVVKVAFNVNPLNSGNIQCNGQLILPNTYFMYRNGTNLTCPANAGQGYKFSSWSNIAYGSSNPLNLKGSQYGGTITANFNQTLRQNKHKTPRTPAVTLVRVRLLLPDPTTPYHQQSLLIAQMS